MKKWKFEKQGTPCVVTVHDDARITITIDNTEYPCKYFQYDGVIFDKRRTIFIGGKDQLLDGIEFDNISEASAYQNKVKKIIKQNDKMPYYLKEKSFNVQYRDGEYLSGYTTYSTVESEIFEELCCGHYVDGWGTYIEKEFIDGDIDKMMQHFIGIMTKKEQEKQKKKDDKKTLLQGVEWRTTTDYEIDEDGKVPFYHHTLIINGHIYCFVERNIFDFGVVINPEYEIAPGVCGGVISRQKDGTLCWKDFTIEKGWQFIRKLEQDEERAIEIVQKYGKYANASIRM